MDSQSYLVDSDYEEILFGLINTQDSPFAILILTIQIQFFLMPLNEPPTICFLAIPTT
jgi:hypothetical protein